ncbi:hypothetical protein FSP39_016403 [Pinctada imbricata]|uniref:Protein polybromo-1 n=1 Tax=Pinctada imbricata TaxID=66713 RepID=A0AA89C065_PINIB|nr:hypothetical protein FSP39_016403 [Pinctada imbricata]
MSKRKRTSGIGERQSEERDVSPAPSTQKRRKKSQYDPTELCQELYETIRNQKSEDGRLLCETFIRVPKRRTAADYYEVVSQPIDLLKIQQKLKTDDYEDIDQMSVDVELMVNNAKSYYKKNSQEYKDACDLWDLYNETKDELLTDAFGDVEVSKADRAERRRSLRQVPQESEMENPENSNDSAVLEERDDPEDIEQLFAAVASAKDNDRDLSLVFHLLPQKSKYPEYFDIIKNPIDMKMIGQRIQDGVYRTLDDIERDFNLMVKNAKTFNEPKSQIYKDAVAIKKIVQAKKQELIQKRSMNIKPPERRNLQRMSAICASLTYPSDEEDILDTSQDISFMEYDEDSETGDHNTSGYRNLNQVADDFNLMFENAKQYNVEDSILYQHSVILQKHMWEKKREIEKKIAKDFLGDEDSQQSFTSNVSRSRRSAGSDSEKKRAKRATPEEMMKRRLWTLYKAVYDYTDREGRPLRYIFMQLPSKRDYPDYYQVIAQPIDLSMIEHKLRAEKYPSEQHLIKDFELLFNNARHYNEENSMVYQDADQLEKVLKHKWKQICHLIETRRAALSKRYLKLKAKDQKRLPSKLQDLYDSVNGYQDSKGRTLSTPFLKLPLKTEYPDYYEVIKKPIDMMRIQQKMQQSQYECVEDMTADFVQMFDNACKYNEPDSLIYKDALTLQRLVLEKKMELIDDGTNEVPDVKALVQEMMTSLFISCYNHQDEEGRCYIDSFAELPERDPDEDLQTSKLKEKPLSFDQIKKNLDKGRYVRMDRFQEDMFKVFQRARKLSRTDSQLYEDAIEMQMFFIKKRDEICKSGEVLLTPALSYTEKHLQAELEAEKPQKLEQEQKEDEEKRSKRDSEERLIDSNSACGSGEAEASFKYKEETFHVGDFVYIEPREKGLDPHIMCIEKMYVDKSSVQTLYGNWFYRPNETFHLATRKFLEKEVFKSDFFTSIPLNQVIGKCHVMSVKDYFKYKPEGFADKDLYVCENRYSNRHRCFKKIKSWQIPGDEPVKFVPREIPLVPVRVASVFADKKEDEDDGETAVIDKERYNITIESTLEDGCQYFEQLKTTVGTFKIGDCCYLRDTTELPSIVRIEKIWIACGEAYFHGVSFVRPGDIPHSPTRLFYRHELFLSSIEAAYPFGRVIGKCAVLHIKEYFSSRITEIPEEDTYLCESKYQEADRTVKKLGKGLKKYSLSANVTDDEVYFFRKAITPQKEPSPLLVKAADESYVMDDSQDSNLDALDESTNMSFETESHFPEFKPTKKAKSSMKRQVSGYIVYSGEIRKLIQNENPQCSFGEISRIVGEKERRGGRPPSGYLMFSKEMRRTIQAESPDMSFGDVSRLVGVKWRNLSKEDKEKYEEKARKIAEEQQAKQQEAERAFNESLQNRSQSPWDYGGKNSPAGSSRPMTPGNYQGQYGYQHSPLHAKVQGQSEAWSVHNSMHPMQRSNSMSPIRPFMPPYQQGGMRPMMPMTPGQMYPGTAQGLTMTMSSQHGGMSVLPPSGMSTSHPKSHPPGVLPPAYPQAAPLSMHAGMPSHGPGQGMVPKQPWSSLTASGTDATMPSYQSQYPASGLSALQEMLRRPFNSTTATDPQQASKIIEFLYVYLGQQMAPPPPPPRPPSPMFVSVPPRTQRLLHSEAYLRYIEGLRADRPYISDWDKSLSATPQNTRTDESRLPSHWLAQGTGYHGNMTNALWALRDMMLKDAMDISRTLPFDALCEFNLCFRFR